MTSRMVQFRAFAPRVEVNGESVLSIVAGMGTFKQRAYKILEASGIHDPQPGSWYPQQAWLDAFKTVSEQVGANTLFIIGSCIPDNARFPSTIDGVESALASIDIAYHMNHRGGEIGVYQFSRTGERSGVVECRNPYPCDFDRGIISGTASKFKPPGGSVRVEHDNSRPCRTRGADSCTYSICW